MAAKVGVVAKSRLVIKFSTFHSVAELPAANATIVPQKVLSAATENEAPPFALSTAAAAVGFHWYNWTVRSRYMNVNLVVTQPSLGNSKELLCPAC